MSSHFYCLSENVAAGLLQRYLTYGEVRYPFYLFRNLANEENQ